MSSEGTAFNSCILDMASRRDSVVEFDADCTADDLTNASHTRDEYQQHPSRAAQGSAEVDHRDAGGYREAHGGRMRGVRCNTGSSMAAVQCSTVAVAKAPVQGSGSAAR